MDQVLEFLKDNWQNMTILLISVITLLVGLFRKKAKITIPLAVLDDIVVKIPEYIIAAESSELKGSEKLQFVVNKCVDLLVAKLGCSRSVALSYYSDFIIGYIENILSTPTKKGVSYEKKIIEESK